MTRAGMLKIHFDIAVGTEDQHRHLGQQRRQVLREQQGRLVGPVEVFQNQQQRLGLRGAADELTEAVPHIAARYRPGNSTGGGMFGKARRSAGAIRAISGATLPSAFESASERRGLIACSIIST